jgi:hypothetical protein
MCYNDYSSGWKIGGPNSGNNKRFLFLSDMPRPALESIQSSVLWIRETFPGSENGRCIKLTSHLHVLPRSISSMPYGLKRNKFVGRDSVVGIAPGYGLDGPGIESRWGARFSLLVQIGPGAHSASYAISTGSFSEVKRPGRGVDHAI